MIDRETYDGIYKTVADIVFESGMARTQSTTVYLDGNGHVGITYATGAMHITDEEYCIGSNIEVNVFDVNMNPETAASLKDMLLILHSDVYERYADVEIKTNTLCALPDTIEFDEIYNTGNHYTPTAHLLYDDEKIYSIDLSGFVTPEDILKIKSNLIDYFTGFEYEFH